MMRRVGSLRVVVSLLGVALLAGACGTSGRELQAPEPGATAPPRSTEAAEPSFESEPLEDSGDVTVRVEDDLDRLFSATTPGWSPGEPLPIEHTCDGAGSSPAVGWSGLPPEATEVAISVVDADDDNYLHWLVVGLPAVDGSIGGGELPGGARALLNDGGTTEWVPPCPPPGESHLYLITVYALSNATEGVLAEGDDPEALLAGVEALGGERSILTVTLER